MFGCLGRPALFQVGIVFQLSAFAMFSFDANRSEIITLFFIKMGSGGVISAISGGGDGLKLAEGEMDAEGLTLVVVIDGEGDSDETSDGDALGLTDGESLPPIDGLKLGESDADGL